MKKLAATSASDALEVIQANLGYSFRSPALLELALTHSSWANEHEQPAAHNQRLEFLGDAVLELCISDAIFHRFPEAREGSMTEMRAAMVSGRALAELALALGLDSALRLGRGEERQDGRRKESLLADAFEAVLAAVYEDGGFVAAYTVIEKVFAERWPRSAGVHKDKDPKTRLQEECQKRFRLTPVYSLVEASGPEHAKIFDVKLELPDGRVFTGREASAKKAEQVAAANALAGL